MTIAESFRQLALQFIDPIQHDYEAIRPLVLGKTTLTERSQQTDIPCSTLSDHARQFLEHGMEGLRDRRGHRPKDQNYPFPDEVAAHILFLKQIYPPMSYREIVRIVARKFGYQTNHHTVKRFLDRAAPPVQLELDFPTFHDFEEAYQARWTVVRLFYEGWRKQSIAGVLRLARSHVYDILESFQSDGFAGLEDQRTRPAPHPDNQMTLPFLEEVRELQHQHPEAGRFRVHGLLDKQYRDGERDQPPPSERTVGRAMVHNRVHHGAPDPRAEETPDPSPSSEDPHARQYRGKDRHHRWFIDLRYLVKLKTGWVYSICIIEGYSRKVLAGLVSPYQDLVAVLQVLHAAIAMYGCPTAIVSDNGSVFRSHGYQAVLAALNITAEYTEKGRPWQNLIESQFGIQRRLADASFKEAETLEQCQTVHATWIDEMNTTPHWAHRSRADGRKTPETVLDWVRGRIVPPEALDHAFRQFQVTRTVNAHGFVSIQRFYIYAERGLARHRVSIWLYEGRLRVEYQQTLLAHYTATTNRRSRRLNRISNPHLQETAYVSPQLVLFELDDDHWKKIYPRPYERRTADSSRGSAQVEQLALFGS